MNDPTVAELEAGLAARDAQTIAAYEAAKVAERAAADAREVEAAREFMRNYREMEAAHPMRAAQWLANHERQYIAASRRLRGEK